MAVAYTLKIRSGCEGGGKDALIQKDKSTTLSTLNDQYLFQPVCWIDSVAGQSEHAWVGEVCPTLKATHYKCPPLIAVGSAGFKAGQGARARSIGYEEEKCPTLASEAGGNSVPSVCVKCYDARGNGDGKTVSTLTGDHENRITDYTSVVCMAHGQANAEICENIAPCPNCNHEQPIVCGLDCRNGRINGDVCGTLQAKPNGGFSYNCIHPVLIKESAQYIVRRLTPTECARLQGFPDGWGHPDQKDDFTDEEYFFWLKVRNTHAAINGKAVKVYTDQQMLSWYNKLHTDSSEYKMWGNGIALPTALYVMQGIGSALEGR